VSTKQVRSAPLWLRWPLALLVRASPTAASVSSAGTTLRETADIAAVSALLPGCCSFNLGRRRLTNGNYGFMSEVSGRSPRGIQRFDAAGMRQQDAVGFRPFDAGFLVLATRAGVQVPIAPVGLCAVPRQGERFARTRPSSRHLYIPPGWDRAARRFLGAGLRMISARSWEQGVTVPIDPPRLPCRSRSCACKEASRTDG
jgi:hypothetical protein